MCTFRRGKSLFNFGISIYSEGGLLTLNTKNYKTLLLRGMYWCKKKNPKISLNKIKLWIYSTREKKSQKQPGLQNNNFLTRFSRKLSVYLLKVGWFEHDYLLIRKNYYFTTNNSQIVNFSEKFSKWTKIWWKKVKKIFFL